MDRNQEVIRTNVAPFKQKGRSKNTKLFLSTLVGFLFISSSFMAHAEPYDNIASINNDFIIEKDFGGVWLTWFS